MKYLLVKELKNGRYLINILCEKSYEALKAAGTLEGVTVFKSELSVEDIAETGIIHLNDLGHISEFLVGNEEKIAKVQGPDISYKDERSI